MATAVRSRAAEFLASVTGGTVHANLAPSILVEHALRRGEGRLAANGALNCDTGDRTGRSPNDKFLEDTPGIHGNIDWGKVNQPITPANFDKLEALAKKYLASRKELYRFDGYAGADPKYRLKVSVITEEAWHSLFAKTLFINAVGNELKGFEPDWVVVNCGAMRVENPAEYGLKTGIGIVQSLERRMVLIFGTRYAGEMKKSIFYAMNYDLPDMDGGTGRAGAGVFPMHCSANVDKQDPTNVALFFGLSGTGKTTLSADPNRRLIGDDEHGWSNSGVFNIEGGCYAKCIKLSKEGEPQIWNAIRFGSVLENVIIDDTTREPDYDSAAKTENTRVTYPVSYVPDAVIPSVGGHPKNVVFLSADAYGVLPPVSKLTPEQAMYYFINGYTSKLAGTEAGVTEPQPNFSACFGGVFLPRPPMVYARQLAEKIRTHGTDVWLLNTGWTGGPYGIGSRFKLSYTRAFVTSILNGSLRNAQYVTHPIFGLHMPTSVPGVPAEVLDPRKTWKDGAAYDAKAKELAKKFRDNDAKFDVTPEVRAAGPKA
ncbi:MAG: phosphoenolpyruvate carboxykinase (ATP) [Phycisphaerae bacterium]|nr:phosphoenolpyruvate carboxykinase (ATP) [Phycisphaerae bacterium]